MKHVLFLLLCPLLGFSAFVPSQVLVKFKEKRIINLNEIQSFNCLFDNVYRIKIKEGIELFDVISKLKQNPDVIYAEPNYIRHICVIPNDPDFNKQWGLSKIKGEDAWDIERGTENVVIAILDTGVDYGHEDLNNKVIKGKDFVNNDSDPMDDHSGSHGTHVAGIAAALTNNNIGIAGLAWDCKILAVKCLDNNGYGNDADIARAIRDAADNGAKVINMSFGGVDPGNTLEGACNYAYEKGCLLVAAAGNKEIPDTDKFYPAGYDSVLAVGATNRNDKKASFSQYGSWVNVGAPGEGIYSTIRNKGYGSMNGTSMASPFVAGLAGLLFSKYQGATNTFVFNRIVSSQDDIGRDDFGRINALYALTGENRPPSQFFLIQPKNEGWTLSLYPTFRWTESKDPDWKDEVRYKVLLSSIGGTLTEVSDTKETFWIPKAISSLSLNTTYIWQVMVIDTRGSITYSGTSSFTTSNLIVYPNPARAGEVIRFRGVPLSYKDAHLSIYTIAGELVERALVGNGEEILWETKDIASGVYIYLISNNDTIFASGKIGIIK